MLIHLRDQLLALQRMAELTKPGGLLISAEEYDRLASLVPFPVSRYRADRESAVVFWLPGIKTWGRMLWTAGYDDVRQARALPHALDRGLVGAPRGAPRPQGAVSSRTTPAASLGRARMASGGQAGATEVDRAARVGTYENARPEVQALVPRDARRLLDLGCASGALGAALKAGQGCSVVGVEVDPLYAARARERLDEVVEADLETFVPETLNHPQGGQTPFDGQWGQTPFDCVVAADVLEHVREPLAVPTAPSPNESARKSSTRSTPGPSRMSVPT